MEPELTSISMISTGSMLTNRFAVSTSLTAAITAIRNSMTSKTKKACRRCVAVN